MTRRGVLRLDRAKFLDLVSSLLQERGRLRLTATGSSMEPFIRSGDVVVIEALPPHAAVRRGEVVLYRDGRGAPVIHRIVGSGAGGLLVAADHAAAGGRLAVVPRADLLGRAVSIERDGRPRPVARGRIWLATVYPLRGILRRARRAADLLAPPGEVEAVPRPATAADRIVRFLGGARGGPIAGRAVAHGVAPYLYRLACEGAFAPSDADLARLRGAYARTLAENTRRLRDLDEAGRAFDRAGVRAVALKGAALVTGPAPVYDDAGLRPMGDLDLLVRPDEAGAAGRILRSLGYEPVGSPSFARLLGKREHLRADGTTVDLHALIRPYPLLAGACRFDAAWLRDGAEGGPVARPAPDALLLHLAFHLALVHLPDRLVWLVDIAETIRRLGPAIDWDRALRRARQGRLRPALWAALAAARDLVGAAPPAEVLRAVAPPARRARRILRAITGDLLGRPRTGLLTLRGHGLHLLLLDGPMALLRAIADAAAPPRAWLGLHLSGAAASVGLTGAASRPATVGRPGR